MEERNFLMIRTLFLFLFLPSAALAQFTYAPDQSIPVSDINGSALSMPWAGGLNAAQYNTLDLNNDGGEDLVLFDRMANKVVTFLRENNRYHYAPEYEAFFPADIMNWLLLRDYNCDGKKDIFTGDIGGIRVYTNTTEAGSPPSWEHYLFHTGFDGPKSDVLLTQGFSAKINLQLQFDDLPAIADADGDGDLDIFNMQYAGDGTIEYHQNLSTENNWNCDSLEFKRITRAWGDVKECACGVFAVHGDDCITSGRTKHAGGKSLLSLDINNDQQPDLIFSEAECAQLYALPNEGTVLAPLVNTYSPFPATHPASMIIFPAAYHEDVDFDGIKDLVVSPNIFSKEFLQSQLDRSNWFYKNNGTNAAPSFTFIKDNFLQEQMIDAGDNAVPAFTDADGDGDEDMFISRHSSPQFSSTVLFYENVGSPATPSFQLRTADYLNLSLLQLFNLKLQFADINSDNTPDLVFTATSFSTNVTSLYFIANKSQTGADFSGQAVTTVNFTMTFQENICVADVDADGQADILAGKSDGSLQYWRNSGEPSALQFTLADDRYLGLDASPLRINVACTTADLDADGNPDLVYTDQTGTIGVIADFRNAVDASEIVTDIVYNPIVHDQDPATYPYTSPNLGGRVWPTVVNLFNSTNPAIVAGTILGGVRVLRHDDGALLPESPVIDVYPNPLVRNEILYVRTDRPATVEIISLLGRQVTEPVRLQPHKLYANTFSSLSAGMYLFKFTTGKKKRTIKRVVVH